MNKLRPLQVYFQSSEWIHHHKDSLFFTYYTCARDKQNDQWECIQGFYEVSDAQSNIAYQSIQHKIVPTIRFDPFVQTTLTRALGSAPKIH
jgi:hypothetical protein